MNITGVYYFARVLFFNNFVTGSPIKNANIKQPGIYDSGSCCGFNTAQIHRGFPSFSEPFSQPCMGVVAGYHIQPQPGAHSQKTFIRMRANAGFSNLLNKSFFIFFKIFVVFLLNLGAGIKLFA